MARNYPINVACLNCIDLFQLESHGQEILDELYIVYCCLLSGPEAASSTHYRHFVMDHSSTITIKESNSLISQGTTGLCSWQVLTNILEAVCICKFSLPSTCSTGKCWNGDQVCCIPHMVVVEHCG